MKNKIRAFVASASVMMMALPMLVAAADGAFDPTAGGGTGLPAGTISGIITNIMNWLLMMVGIVGVIGFAISGILYLTAAGDESNIDRAKSAMMYSIIGVIVAIIGVVVLTAVKSLLGGSSTTF